MGVNTFRKSGSRSVRGSLIGCMEGVSAWRCGVDAVDCGDAGDGAAAGGVTSGRTRPYISPTETL